MAEGDAVTPLPALAQLGRPALIAAAFDLLDDKGLERLGLRRLGEQLGIDAAAIRRHFVRRRDLIDAMAGVMLKEAETPIPANAGWQDLLRHRAAMTRRAMLSHRDGALLMGRSPARPGDRTGFVALAAAGFPEDAAEAALELIDRFTLGWAVSEQSSGTRGYDTDARFAARIDTIIGAVTPGDATPAAPAIEAKPAQPSFLQLRLLKMLHAARESADIAYSRTIKLVELDRRILLLLESHGALVPAGVSASMGVDKAQVSRSVKRLEELGLIRRDGVRSPLVLTPAGHALTERMMRLAELRNRELTFGVTDDQIVTFFAVLEHLMARAILLLEQERKLIAAGRTETPLGYPDLEDDVSSGKMVVERSRIVPPLITLSSYAMRSAALAFKRLTGLSNFESWVLNEIAREPPMAWSRLVQAVDRDQSQAGRTVKHLMEKGLIIRNGPPERRHGTFEPTAEGARLHALLEHAGRQRSEFLMQNLSGEQLDLFFTVFEIIAHNAEAQLNRERALDETERASA